MHPIVFDRIFIISSIFIAAALLGPEDAIAQARPNFSAFQVKTDLQRMLVSDQAITNVVFINGGALRIKDGKIDNASFDFEPLKKELKDENRKGGTLAVHLVLDFIKDKEYLMNQDRVKIEGRTLTEFAKSLGFDRRTGVDHGSISWNELLSQVESRPAGEANSKENPVKKKGVAIYPVRTAMSRFLCMNADCIVDIETTFDAKWDGLLEPDMFDDINAAIEKLEFDGRDTIQFRIRYQAPAQKAVGEFSKN